MNEKSKPRWQSGKRADKRAIINDHRHTEIHTVWRREGGSFSQREEKTKRNVLWPSSSVPRWWPGFCATAAASASSPCLLLLWSVRFGFVELKILPDELSAAQHESTLARPMSKGNGPGSFPGCFAVLLCCLLVPYCRHHVLFCSSPRVAITVGQRKPDEAMGARLCDVEGLN